MGTRTEYLAGDLFGFLLLPTKIKVTLTRGSSVQPQLITSAEKDNNNKGNLIEVDSEPFL